MKKLLLTVSLLSYSLFWTGLSSASPKYYQLSFQNFSKKYEYVTLPRSGNAPTIEIAYIPVCDEVELTFKAAQALYDKIVTVHSFRPEDIDTVVVPGDKANALGYALTLKLLDHHEKSHSKKEVKLAVLRTSNKTGKAQYHEQNKSITSQNAKTFYLTDIQQDIIKDKKVLILDDVITTGSTLDTASALVAKAGGKLLGYACIATEGSDWKGKQEYKRHHLLQLANIPYYINGKEK